MTKFTAKAQEAGRWQEGPQQQPFWKEEKE